MVEDSQYFLEIIAISGKIGSGKDYLARLIINNYIDKGIPFIQLAFADALKLTLLAENNTVTYNTLFVNKTKESRILLQQIGEDKRKIDKDYWINMLFNTILLHKERGIQKIIISDLRFENEFDSLVRFSSLNRMKLKTIRLYSVERTRDKIMQECCGDMEQYKIISENISETSLDLYESMDKFTHRICNDYGIELEKEIKDFFNFI